MPAGMTAIATAASMTKPPSTPDATNARWRLAVNGGIKAAR
jgi:hypothetical protein